MNPLDRINQLNNENALLRSQLHDAQEQVKRDSETIARLARNETKAQELTALLRRSASYFQETGTLGQQGEFVPNISDRETATAIEVWGFLSRHA